MALTVGGGGAAFQPILNQHPKTAGSKENKLTTTEGSIPDDADAMPVEDESPVALLQRFAESTDEMSAAMAQFRNRRDLEKKTGAAAESSFDRVLDEDVHGKVDQIMKAVKGTANINIDDLLRFVKSLFPDDSDLVLVLREMLRRRGLDKVVKGRLEKLLEHAEQQADPKKLKAGINVALKARLFGKALDMSPALMRESYRNFIESESHEVLIYQDWIISYGSEHRTIVVDFMESALISDIDALDPSCSNIEFGDLLGRIGQLKLLRSSDIAFVRTLLNTPLVKEINDVERDWVFFMLGLLQHAASFGDHFANLVRQQELLKRSKLSRLLQLIYRACKKIPQELFFEHMDKENLEQELGRMASETWQQENAELRKEIDRMNESRE